MIIKEIRALTGLSQPKFCQKYHIPLNTFIRWEQGKREPPDYLVELLEFKVMEDMKMEKIIPIEMVDEMKELKDALKSVSAQNAEDMLKHLTTEEKDCLLRLYVHEGGINGWNSVKFVRGRGKGRKRILGANRK